MPYGVINADVLSTSSGQTLGAGNATAFKNRIINGAMVIDQRNAGASTTPTSNAYNLDRWTSVMTQSSKFSVQQNAGSVTPPAGFTNYLGVTSSSAYAVTSTDTFLIQQRIEGLNAADLAWGTTDAKTVTLSFWVRSSLTGTFGGSIENASVARAYPFTYTISSANTWEYKTITIAGDTTGTWATDNSTWCYLNFNLGTGTSLSGTAGAWAATDYRSATGATSVVGTNGATFYITGVQLEVGSSATSFEVRDYGRELYMCYRYCQKLTAASGFAYQTFGWGNGNGTNTNNYMFVPTLAPLRSTPTVTYSALATSIGSSGTSVSSIAGPAYSQNLVHLTVTGGTYSLGQSINIQCDGNASGYLQFSAEL